MLQLKVVREDEGRKASWLARMTDVSPSYVCKVENGVLPPSQGFKQRVARVLNRPESELFAVVN